MLRQRNAAVTDKQHGDVRTASHVCWEISPTETFTEEEFYKQGKNNLFNFMFRIHNVIDISVTVIIARFNRGNSLWVAGVFPNSYLS